MTTPNYGPERLKEMSDATRAVVLEEQVKWLNRRVDDLTDRLAAAEHNNFITKVSIIIILGVAFALATVTLL